MTDDVDAQEKRLVRALALANPELERMLESHVADNFGVLLPHLYLGELTSWIVNAFAHSRHADVGTVLAILDREFETNEAVRNLIDVSFLENLPLRDEQYAEIREMLGPSLTAQLRQTEL